MDHLNIKNCKGIYEPREDSYMLATCVEEYAFGNTLDLGAGTGMQGITAAKKGCKVTFADIDKNAIECCRKNAASNKISAKFVISDLFDNINQKFDTIIFNPPYLPSNDKKYLAYDGGKSGRDLINRFIASYKSRVAKKHIVLMLESSFNNYENDVKRLKAKIIAKEHYFFEDLVVLLFE